MCWCAVMYVWVVRGRDLFVYSSRCVWHDACITFGLSRSVGGIPPSSCLSVGVEFGLKILSKFVCACVCVCVFPLCLIVSAVYFLFVFCLV